MNEEIFLTLKSWFNNYVSTYSFSEASDQVNIDLKFEHTYKVIELITTIAEEILSEEELYLAKIIALFHDLGRFEQYKHYKTFSDAKSEDHAALAIKIILENDLLAAIPQESSQLILKAISYHNKMNLAEDETDKVLLYSKLIRDADKLDIWRVVINDYNQEDNNKVVGLGLTSTNNISDSICQQIMAEKPVDYKDLKTLNDLKLTQMGWVYDINFKKSLEIIEEREYIDKLFMTLPPSAKARQVYEQIKSYISDKLIP
jgi:hypothetical protein